MKLEFHVEDHKREIEPFHRPLLHRERLSFSNFATVCARTGKSYDIWHRGEESDHLVLNRVCRVCCKR